MKKLILLLLLLLATLTQAQTISLTKKFTTTAVATDTALNLIGSGVNGFELLLTGSGTRTTCSIEVDSSIDGVTWNTADVIASTTCTSNVKSVSGFFLANYVRLNVTVLTGASNTVNAVLLGFTNYPIDPCSNPLITQTQTAIANITSSAKIIANGGGTTQVYICGISINAGGTAAGNFQFKTGSGTVCATNGVVQSGTYTNSVLGATQSFGFAGRTVLQMPSSAAATTGDFCIVVSGGTSPAFGGYVMSITQ